MEQNVFLAFADPNGNVQSLNAGTSDNAVPIYFEVESQEIEFVDRTHLKKISDDIAVFTAFGIDSTLQASVDGMYKQIPMKLTDRVNIGKNINLEGYYFTFLWSGESATVTPIFGGIVLENITDLGMTEK